MKGWPQKDHARNNANITRNQKNFTPTKRNKSTNDQGSEKKHVTLSKRYVQCLPIPQTWFRPCHFVHSHGGIVAFLKKLVCIRYKKNEHRNRDPGTECRTKLWEKFSNFAIFRSQFNSDIRFWQWIQSKWKHEKGRGPFNTIPTTGSHVTMEKGFFMAHAEDTKHSTFFSHCILNDATDWHWTRWLIKKTQFLARGMLKKIDSVYNIGCVERL